MEHAVGEVCTLCSGLPDLPDCCWGEWSGEEEVGAEVEGESILYWEEYCKQWCVCVCLHLLVIGRGRERGRVFNISINERVEWMPQGDKRVV